MSDFYRNDPRGNAPFDGEERSEGGPNRWQQPDPLSAEMPSQPLEEDFSAWRRPDQVASPSFLMDEPMPYGAEMQQGGVPLFGAESPFSQDQGDAPTRIGAPIIPPQMVNRRKTVDRGERPAPAPRFSPEEPGFSMPEDLSTMDGNLPGAPVVSAAQREAPVPGRHRRVGRTARYQEETTPQQPAESAVGFVPPPKPTSFDPFEAGDAEAEEAAESRPLRRPAVPGERYTGARTAMPKSGAPVLRSQVGALPDYEEDVPPRERVREQAGMRHGEDEGSLRERVPAPGRGQGRPPQDRPPQVRPPQARPPQDRPPQVRVPQMRELSEDSMEGRPLQDRPPQARPPQNRSPQDRPPQDRPPQVRQPQDRPQQVRPPQARGAQGMPPRQAGDRRPKDFEDERERYQPSGRGGYEDNADYRRQASVKRPAYDFEDEDEIDVRRRSGCLVPILIVLLLVGALLAGLCLPAWDATSGGIAGTLGTAKNTVMNLFSAVKNAVAPEEEAITQFTVVPTDGTAPAELVFNVQTSTKVTSLRILDQNADVVLEKILTDADTLGGDVTKNSKGMIWVLRYTVKDAYQGLYTVQAQEPDGTWGEGMALNTPVNIAAPAIPEPPIQGFRCDTSEGAVPATVGFTAETSADVVEVRIVDDYGTTVASYTLGDEETEEGSAFESGTGITWEFKALVSEAYEGNYTLQYRTSSDLNFTLSDDTAYVELTAPVQENTSDTGDALLSEGVEDTGELAGEEQGGEGGAFAAEEGAEETAEEVGGEEPVVAANASAPEVLSEQVVEPQSTAAPEATPVPKLSAQADAEAAPSEISLKPTIYQGDKTATSYNRAKAISMVDPFNYALWPQSGVLTFRGGPFRQNAAYGTAQISQESLTQIWKADVGSTKLSKSTVYGIVWPGQPVIVKWPTEIRNLMAILKEKQATNALKEVILGGQDGKIYFLDLMDGQPTRDPIDMGAPSSGGASIATNIAPILGMGQSHGNLSGKQVDNGYHLYDLLTNKRLMLITSREKAANSNYTGVSGAALFDKVTGTAIFGSQNGLLYFAELGNQQESFDYDGGKLKVKNPAIEKYKTQASKQDKKNTNIDASVAMYNNYVFYGDEVGVLQCVDVNTLTPVWAVKTGDNIDSTPALDMEGETLALYTANTIQAQGKKGVCTIRRYDGLSGKQVWEYQVPDVAYASGFTIGCVASPVVGEKAIGDLVIFTATNGKKGSVIMALKKSNGELVWSKNLESESLSSPVAVYSDTGDAWIVQAESNGNVHLMDGKTGEIKNTLKLDGEIQASPAVYKNTLVIGTTGKDKGAIYGIQIQ